MEWRVRITVKANLDEFMNQLEANVFKRLPIAAVIAINKTAGEVWLAEQEEMRAVFDRPTPDTLAAVRYSKATTQKLEAAIWLDDSDRSGGGHPKSEQLIPQIYGGVRVDKRSEYILRNAGILPAGMSIVPGRAARFDAYGNISTGQVRQILSALRISERGVGSTSNRPLPNARETIGSTRARRARARARAGDYFVAQRDRPHGRHLAPGIYQRTPGRILPILMFVQRPSYQPVLDFNRVANEVIDAVFADHLREQVAISVRKAA